VAAAGFGSGAPLPPRKDPSSTLLLGLIGFMVVLLAGLLGGLAWYLLKDDGDSSATSTADATKPTATIAIPTTIPYSLTLADDKYDLESMQLRNADMPEGVVRQSRNDVYTFTNEEWAQVLNADDSAAAERSQNQLDAQKRVRNLVSLYGWDDIDKARIGQALSFLSQSTLYETEDAAIADTKKLCGLRIDETDPLKEFSVPKLGDESVGFTVVSPNTNFGHTVDTVICFRTGRIVSGVVQTSFLGSENRSLVLELAKKMLLHVNETFQGKPVQLDDEPPPPTPG
jgi:hypothetical protein